MDALEEFLEARRISQLRFPVQYLIRMWLKTNPIYYHNTYRGTSTYLLGRLAQWLAPIEIPQLTPIPIPWYVDANTLKAAAGMLGTTKENLYAILCDMEKTK